MFHPLDLSGRSIVVTGASSGIGRATAIYLSRLGARLVLVARRKEGLEETRGSLDKAPLETPGESAPAHVIAPYDLAEVDGIPEWLRTMAGEHGPIHGIVHCAGEHLVAPLQQLDLAKFDALMRVNFYAAVQLVKGLRQKNVTASSASVVWVTSVMAIVGQPAVAAYAGSKGAMTAACRALALELAHQRIRVNCVAPGHTLTEMALRQQQRMTPEQIQRLTDLHPLGMGEPNDVAGAIAFMLSDAARWITGTTLVVDGGYTSH